MFGRAVFGSVGAVFIVAFQQAPNRPHSPRRVLPQGADINSYGHTMWTALVSQAPCRRCGQIKTIYIGKENDTPRGLCRGTETSREWARN